MTMTEWDIERLVTWALRDQGLGWDSATSSKSVLGQLMALGTRVDTSGSVRSPSAALWTDDDALHIRKAIDELPDNQRTLIVRLGRAALQPDWIPEGEGVPEPILDTRGRPRWEKYQFGGERQPMLDLLAWSARVEEVKFFRREWSTWHAGLTALLPLVNATMTTHRAIGPSAPAEPWNLPQGVVHGLGEVEPSVEGQPWLDIVDDADRTETIGERRARAQAPVRARAGDWGVPSKD